MENSKVYIYHIICKPTMKGYIGSTINIYKRKSGHFEQLRKNIHGNKYLQNAYNKYGEKSFEFKVVFEGIKEYRNKIEEWFINKSNFNTEFNLMLVDSKDYSIKSSFKRLKKEDIYKIFELIKGKHSLKEIANIFKMGQNTIRYVIQNKYYSDITIPEEIKEVYKQNGSKNRKESARSRAPKLYTYKLNGEFIDIFNSTPEAAEALNLNRNSILNALNRGIQLKGFLFYREEKFFKKYIPAQTYTKRVIYVFDKSFNLILKSDSMVNCAKQLNINSNRINSSCNRLTLSQDYYFVRDKDLQKFKDKYNILDKLEAFGEDKIALRLLDNELGQ